MLNSDLVGPEGLCIQIEYEEEDFFVVFIEDKVVLSLVPEDDLEE